MVFIDEGATCYTQNWTLIDKARQYMQSILSTHIACMTTLEKNIFSSRNGE